MAQADSRAGGPRGGAAKGGTALRSDTRDTGNMGECKNGRETRTRRVCTLWHKSTNGPSEESSGHNSTSGRGRDIKRGGGGEGGGGGSGCVK